MAPNLSVANEDRKRIDRLYRNGQSWHKTNDETRHALHLKLTPLAEALDAAESFFLAVRELVKKWYDSEDRFEFYTDYWHPLGGNISSVKKKMRQQSERIAAAATV